jgi:hypothetical protein
MQLYQFLFPVIILLPGQAYSSISHGRALKGFCHGTPQTHPVGRILCVRI